MTTETASLNFVSPLHRRSTFFFFPDGEGGGTAGGSGDGGAAGAGESGGGDDGATKPPKKAPPDTVPRSEAQKAFKARDRAKAGIAQFAQTFGIEPDEVQIEDTGDADNPFKLTFPGMEELKTQLADVRKAKKDGARKAGAWEERETELNAAHQRKVKGLTDKADRRIAARDSWIRERAVESVLRDAATRAKVLPEGIADAVKLASDRVKFESADDEESDDPHIKVNVSMLDADGTPMLVKGEPATVDQLMAEVLKARPYLVQAQYRNGPGAGDNTRRTGQPASTNNGNHQDVRPAGFMFGMAGRQ